MMLITSGSSRPMPVLKCQLVRQHPDCSAYRRLRLVQAGSSPARVTTAAASLLLQTPLRAPSKRWSGTGSKCNPGPVLPLFSGVWGLAKAQRVQGRAPPRHTGPAASGLASPASHRPGRTRCLWGLKALGLCTAAPMLLETRLGSASPRALSAPVRGRLRSSVFCWVVRHPAPSVCNTRPSR